MNIDLSEFFLALKKLQSAKQIVTSEVNQPVEITIIIFLLGW